MCAASPGALPASARLACTHSKMTCWYAGKALHHDWRKHTHRSFQALWERFSQPDSSWPCRIHQFLIFQLWYSSCQNQLGSTSGSEARLSLIQCWCRQERLTSSGGHRTSGISRSHPPETSENSSWAPWRISRPFLWDFDHSRNLFTRVSIGYFFTTFISFWLRRKSALWGWCNLPCESLACSFGASFHPLVVDSIAVIPVRATIALITAHSSLLSGIDLLYHFWVWKATFLWYMIALVVVQINPLVDISPVETDNLFPETLEWDFLPFSPKWAPQSRPYPTMTDSDWIRPRGVALPSTPSLPHLLNYAKPSLA